MPALLNDLIPRVESAFVLGLPDPAVLDVVLERSRATTILVSSLAEVADRIADLPETVEVVEDSLSRFVAQRTGERRELVFAADGLDALLSPSDTTSWQTRLGSVSALVQPGGALVVGVDNDAPLTSLVRSDQRVDWARTDDDPTRPTSASQLLGALASVGQPVATVHGLYGAPSRPTAAVSDAAASRARDGSLPAQVIEHVTESGASSGPAVADLIALSARTGQLSSLATRWLAVCGGRGRSVYWTSSDGSVVWADQASAGQDWVIGGDAGVAATLPQRIPDAETVERRLLRLVASANDAGFRDLAAQVGSWVRSSADAAEVRRISLDDVRVGPAGLSRGLGLVDLGRDRGVVAAEETPGAAASASPDRRLTEAWRRFATRYTASGRESLWPAMLSEEDLVALWLTMSDVTTGPEPLTPDVDTAPTLATADGDGDRTDVRAKRLALLEDRVQALTETLATRDKQLLIREGRIRSLRNQALGAARNRDFAQKQTADLRASRTFKMANMIRRATLVTRPKRLARGFAGRLDGRVRAIRRMR